MKYHTFQTRTAFIFLFAVCFLAVSIRAAQAFEPVRPAIVSPRLTASGGANPAHTGLGIDTLSTNPAALAFAERELRILGVSAAVSGQFTEIPGILDSEDIADAVIQSVRKNSGVYFGLDATGPLSLAYVNRNFGLGIFNRTFASADAAAITSGRIAIGEEILITGGFGFKLLETRNHELSLGIQGKAFVQLPFSEEGSITSLIEKFKGFSLDEQPADTAFGIGFDAGILYRFAGCLSAGLVCRDIYTPVFYSSYDSLAALKDGRKASSGHTTMDRQLAAGISWSAPIPRSWHTVTGFTASLGYSDLLSIADPLARNPVLNVTLGAEATFFHILSLRAGIHDTYPAVGLGLNLRVIRLDLAVYGEELGLEPGERGVFNAAVGLSFGF